LYICSFSASTTEATTVLTKALFLMKTKQETIIYVSKGGTFTGKARMKMDLNVLRFISPASNLVDLQLIIIRTVLITLTQLNSTSFIGSDTFQAQIKHKVL